MSRRYRANTRHQRRRRTADPTYRERYNELRRAYYHEMKNNPEYKAKLQAKAVKYRQTRYMITLDDTQLTYIRDNIFGPCTSTGECYSVQELREDIYDLISGKPLTRAKLRDWFRYRISIELHDMFPENKYPDGPTAKQLAQEHANARELKSRINKGIKEFMQGLN
jgi:hypothetical protein